MTILQKLLGDHFEHRSSRNLAAAIGRLGPLDRELIRRVRVGHDFRRIAVDLGVSHDRCVRIYYGALSRLRQHLVAMEHEE
jgi:FixJ family two-component response regulator